MKTNGSECNGLTFETDLQWINPFLADSDYSDSELRNKLLKFLSLNKEKNFSMAYLIRKFIERCDLSNDKKIKINTLLVTVNPNEYLLLLGLISNLLKNDKSNKRRKTIY